MKPMSFRTLMVVALLAAHGSGGAQSSSGAATPANPFADQMKQIMQIAAPVAPPPPPPPVAEPASPVPSAAHLLERVVVLYVHGDRALLSLPTTTSDLAAPRTLALRSGVRAFFFSQWVIPEIRDDAVTLYAAAPHVDSAANAKGKRTVKGLALWHGRVETAGEPGDPKERNQNVAAPEPVSVGVAPITPSSRVVSNR